MDASQQRKELYALLLLRHDYLLLLLLSLRSFFFFSSCCFFPCFLSCFTFLASCLFFWIFVLQIFCAERPCREEVLGDARCRSEERTSLLLRRGEQEGTSSARFFFFFFPPYIFLLKQLAAAERRNRSHKRHFNSPHRGPESTRTLATFSGPLPCLLFRSAYCEQVYAFDIAIAGKIWTLGCDTREEMEDWIEVLRQWLFP